MRLLLVLLFVSCAAALEPLTTLRLLTTGVHWISRAPELTCVRVVGIACRYPYTLRYRHISQMVSTMGGGEFLLWKRVCDILHCEEENLPLWYAVLVDCLVDCISC
jgi:hypothetical protein